MTKKSLIPTLRRTGAMVMAVLAVMAFMACPGKSKHHYDDEEEEGEEEVTEGESALDQITDEFLNSFDPNVPFEQTGHSHAFRIQPREDITISADAGAFEHDVQMTVSDLTPAEMKRLDSKITDSGRGMMLFAYDISAGLGPDKVIPGSYRVSFDLKKRGVPKEVWPMLRISRIRGDGSVEPISAHLTDDGQLYYEACQNSTIVASLVWALCIFGTAYYAAAHWPDLAMGMSVMSKVGWSTNWIKENDIVTEYVNDPFGNFRVVYRHSKTEDSDRTQFFLELWDKLHKLVSNHEAEALSEYASQHPDFSLNWGDGQPAEERHRTALALLIAEKCQADDEIKEILDDPFLEHPQSVRNAIDGIKLANRYLRTVQKLKPLSEEFAVFLGAPIVAGNAQGMTLRLPGAEPFIAYNFEGRMFGSGTYIKDSKDAFNVTTCHELVHLNHLLYNPFPTLGKDDRFIEALGAYIELKYAKWMQDKGLTTFNMDVHTKEADKYFDFSSRQPKELLSFPLDQKYPSDMAIMALEVSSPNTDGGYMLADLVDYLLEHKKVNGKTVSLSRMMKGNIFEQPLTHALLDIFDIKDYAELNELYDGFIAQHAAETGNRQGRAYDLTHNPNLLPSINFMMTDPVQQIKNYGFRGQQKVEPYCAKVVHISDSSLLEQPYTLFALIPPMMKLQPLKFSFINPVTGQLTEDPCYVQPCKDGYRKDVYAAIISHPREETLTDPTREPYIGGPIDVVALYKPIYEPEVKGRSRDGRGLVIAPLEKPEPKLLQARLLTGMQIAVMNNKTEKVCTFVVNTDNWKEKFVAPYDKLGITDPDDIDVTLQSRWFYRTPEGKSYHGPASDKEHYEFYRSHEEQREEPTDTTEIITEGGEEGTDDLGNLGEIDIVKKVRITEEHYPNDRLYKEDYKSDIYAELKMKDGEFTIHIPAHTVVKGKEEHYGDSIIIPNIQLKGKYTVETDVTESGYIRFIKYYYETSEVTIVNEPITIKSWWLEYGVATGYHGTDVIRKLANESIDDRREELFTLYPKNSPSDRNRPDFSGIIVELKPQITHTHYNKDGSVDNTNSDFNGFMWIEMEFLEYPQ